MSRLTELSDVVSPDAKKIFVYTAGEKYEVVSLLRRSGVISGGNNLRLPSGINAKIICSELDMGVGEEIRKRCNLRFNPMTFLDIFGIMLGRGGNRPLNEYLESMLEAIVRHHYHTAVVRDNIVYVRDAKEDWY